MARRIMHIDLDAFFVSVEQVFNPELKGELGLCASVGIASCKVVAKIASELSKTDGLLEVANGEERPFLAPLPIAELPGIGKKSQPILRGLGINTIKNYLLCL